MYDIHRLTVTDRFRISEIETSVFLRPWSTAQIRDTLGDLNHLSIGAFENGHCIGYALFSHILDEAELLRVAVPQEKRQQGIATHLIKTGLHILNKKGVRRVFLEVRVDNDSAIHMYESLNFIKVSIRKNYYNDGDAVIYRWEDKHGYDHIGD